MGARSNHNLWWTCCAHTILWWCQVRKNPRCLQALNRDLTTGALLGHVGTSCDLHAVLCWVQWAFNMFYRGFCWEMVEREGPSSTVSFSLLCRVCTCTQLNSFLAVFQCLALCPGKVMDSRAEMEVVRSTKGNAAGEVSVHVVTTESTVQSTHLPTTAFIIPGMQHCPL